MSKHDQIINRYICNLLNTSPAIYGFALRQSHHTKYVHCKCTFYCFRLKILIDFIIIMCSNFFYDRLQ